MLTSGWHGGSSFATTAATVSSGSSSDTASESAHSIDHGKKVAVVASVATVGAVLLAVGIFYAVLHAQKQSFAKAQAHSRKGSSGPMRPLHLGTSPRQVQSAYGGADYHHHQSAVGAPHGREMSQREQSRMSWYSYGSGSSGSSSRESGSSGNHGRTTSVDHHIVGDRRSSWFQFSDRRSRERSGSSGGRTASGTLKRNPSDASAYSNGSGRQGPRRVQIMRGADGHLAGIGRPVMQVRLVFSIVASDDC